MKRALIIIDIQNDYFTDGALPLFEAEACEARILTAIAAAQKAGDRIILVQHVSASGLFAAENPGTAIRANLLRAAQDAPIVVKSYADAFQETELDQHLAGATNLLICGMMTQNCVVFTAMSRAADPYQVTVLKDLCTAPSQIVHAVALSALASKLDVKTSAEVW